MFSIIGSIAIRRVVSLETEAVHKSFEWATSELNTRESLTWSKTKTSDSDWVDDSQLFASVDCNLGPEYIWRSKTDTGGKLNFRGKQIEMVRLPSTHVAPGRWRMK